MAESWTMVEIGSTTDVDDDLESMIAYAEADMSKIYVIGNRNFWVYDTTVSPPTWSNVPIDVPYAEYYTVSPTIQRSGNIHRWGYALRYSPDISPSEFNISFYQIDVTSLSKAKYSIPAIKNKLWCVALFGKLGTKYEWIYADAPGELISKYYFDETTETLVPVTHYIYPGSYLMARRIVRYPYKDGWVSLYPYGESFNDSLYVYIVKLRSDLTVENRDEVKIVEYKDILIALDNMCINPGGLWDGPNVIVLVQRLDESPNAWEIGLVKLAEGGKGDYERIYGYWYDNPDVTYNLPATNGYAIYWSMSQYGSRNTRIVKYTSTSGVELAYEFPDTVKRVINLYYCQYSGRIFCVYHTGTTIGVAYQSTPVDAPAPPNILEPTDGVTVANTPTIVLEVPNNPDPMDFIIELSTDAAFSPVERRFFSAESYDNWEVSTDNGATWSPMTGPVTYAAGTLVRYTVQFSERLYNATWYVRAFTVV